MGQYFSPTNITKMEYLYSFDYDNPSKLTETAWLKNNYIHTIINLLKDEWYGNQIIFCGDYAEDAKEYYKKGDKITPAIATDSQVDDNIKNYALVNFIKKQYCYIDCCPMGEDDWEGWQINPLPLLLANSNGAGPGDYGGNDDIASVGSWAYDEIGVLPKDIVKKLEHFTKMTYSFKP